MAFQRQESFCYALEKAFQSSKNLVLQQRHERPKNIDTNLYCYDQELAHYYVEVMEITKMENVNAILDGRAKNVASDMTSAKLQIAQVC